VPLDGVIGRRRRTTHSENADRVSGICRHIKAVSGVGVVLDANLPTVKVHSALGGGDLNVRRTRAGYASFNVRIAKIDGVGRTAALDLNLMLSATGVISGKAFEHDGHGSNRRTAVDDYRYTVRRATPIGSDCFEDFPQQEPFT
jgi:hypothetical protein